MYCMYYIVENCIINVTSAKNGRDYLSIDSMKILVKWKSKYLKEINTINIFWTNIIKDGVFKNNKNLFINLFLFIILIYFIYNHIINWLYFS
jgi:hypothetical protein